MGFQVDPGLLESIASSLRNSGTSLADTAGSPPEPPDAGELTGQMSELMAAFMDGTAELVAGVSAAGDAVADGGTTYGETDDEAIQQLHQ